MSEGQTMNARKPAVYWAATLLAALAFAIPGAALLARAPHFAEGMAHLGYPAYLLPFLGTLKVMGAVVIAAPGLPRVKEWAYAGMLFDIAGAIVSRAATGDGALSLIIPLLIGAVVATSWALRPSGRTLRAVQAS